MTLTIALLTITIIVIAICIILAKATKGDSLYIATFSIVVIVVLVKCKTTTIDAMEIPISELSIMCDDEVAIIRYNDNNHTYYKIKEYKAIKDSSFSFTETKEYNILGEQIDETYKLTLNN